MVGRNFSEPSGHFSSYEEQNEQSCDLENNAKCLGGAKKFMLVIPAVPLRCVPTTDVELDHEKIPVTLRGKVGVVGGKRTNNDDDKVHSREESWKRDSEKIAAVLAEAKDFINAFDVRYSTSSSEPKPSLDTVNQEKLRAESIRKRKLDEILSGKRTRVEDRAPQVVQVQESSGSKSADEEEVCVVSPQEWNMSRLCSRKKCDGAKASTGEIGTKQVNSEKEIEVIDLVGECSIGTKSDGQSERDSDCEVPEDCEKESDESLKYSSDGQKELINFRIVKHDQPEGFKVMEALKLFEEQYTALLRAELAGERKPSAAHSEAGSRLRTEGMWILAEKPFGHIPGVEISDEFRFRVELAIVGLHCQLFAGIDHVILDGKKFATSVVNSGRYENNAKALDILIYSGQGGNSKIPDVSLDQKLERGNIALVNSMKMGYLVRVTHKRTNPVTSKALGMSNERNYMYVYDGLYTIKRYWEERDRKNKLVFKFELHRMLGQPRPRRTKEESRKPLEVCVVDDVAQGKETLEIHAMNGVDDDRPPNFVYTTTIVYPHWYQPIEPVGCDCVDGCSDSRKCPCVLKNGGEIPFNEDGAIIRAKSRVHECGPNCKCPPSCMNRVTQLGPRLQLEIFKTKSRGWGVRSRDYISSGSFICEYVGELLEEKEAEQRIDDDEYLFDICDDGFAVDAAMYGNIGRFINHSCTPNLYAQEVLYDHADERMPHITFFATKNIPPLQELTYDYNYKIGRVCDANGNIKRKDCYCGARKCSGRMY